ncbi:MAG: thiamine pyrophosphate-dependent enzyme [Nitrososphaerales archaeon]
MSKFKLISTIKELPIEEGFSPGHGLCAGCTIPTIIRMVTKIAKGNIIVVSPTGCLEVSTSVYPTTAWKIPWIHVAFENAAAVASGVKSAFSVLKRKGMIVDDPFVVVIGGDGGTADIGIQAMSGMFERQDKVTYICYDNEAYMNTGIQRSGATPYGAWTTTTPFGVKSIGKAVLKKDLFSIAIAHKVKYAATVSIGYVNDMLKKLSKALINTPSFIHYLQPCPTGWRFDPALSVKIGKLAVQTGLWPLLEYENGKVKVTVSLTKRLPVTEYLKHQGRFKHLFKKYPQIIEELQSHADELAEEYGFSPLVSTPI